MKDFEAKLGAVMERLDTRDRNSLEEAANLLLEADGDISGDVAIIDDPSFGQFGMKGKVVRAHSHEGSGFVDVQLPNGTIVPIPKNLLLKV